MSLATEGQPPSADLRCIEETPQEGLAEDATDRSICKNSRRKRKKSLQSVVPQVHGTYNPCLLGELIYIWWEERGYFCQLLMPGMDLTCYPTPLAICNSSSASAKSCHCPPLSPSRMQMTICMVYETFLEEWLALFFKALEPSFYIKFYLEEQYINS